MTKHNLTAYQHGCRCDVCRAHAAEYARAYRTRVAAQGPDTVKDPVAVRAKIADLKRRGLSQDEIARLAGVNRTTVSRIVHGSPVHRATAARFLAINERDVEATNLVSREPWDRRVATLLARGHSALAITRCGVPYHHVHYAWKGNQRMAAGRVVAYLAATEALKAEPARPMTKNRAYKVARIRAKWSF